MLGVRVSALPAWLGFEAQLAVEGKAGRSVDGLFGWSLLTCRAIGGAAEATGCCGCGGADLPCCDETALWAESSARE